MSQHVRTVLGDVPADQLGITLMHEHLFCDLTAYLEPSAQVTQRKLAQAKVDITNLGVLRRDPFAIWDNGPAAGPLWRFHAAEWAGMSSR